MSELLVKAGMLTCLNGKLIVGQAGDASCCGNTNFPTPAPSPSPSACARTADVYTISGIGGPGFEEPGAISGLVPPLPFWILGDSRNAIALCRSVTVACAWESYGPPAPDAGGTWPVPTNTYTFAPLPQPIEDGFPTSSTGPPTETFNDNAGYGFLLSGYDGDNDTSPVGLSLSSWPSDIPLIGYTAFAPAWIVYVAHAFQVDNSTMSAFRVMGGVYISPYGALPEDGTYTLIPGTGTTNWMSPLNGQGYRINRYDAPPAISVAAGGTPPFGCPSVEPPSNCGTGTALNCSSPPTTPTALNLNCPVTITKNGSPYYSGTKNFTVNLSAGVYSGDDGGSLSTAGYTQLVNNSPSTTDGQCAFDAQLLISTGDNGSDSDTFGNDGTNDPSTGDFFHCLVSEGISSTDPTGTYKLSGGSTTFTQTISTPEGGGPGPNIFVVTAGPLSLS